MKFQQAALGAEIEPPEPCQVTPNINYFYHFLMGAPASTPAVCASCLPAGVGLAPPRGGLGEGELFCRSPAVVWLGCSIF